MAGVCRSGRQRGKSDPIDALAVARAALREPLLPLAKVDVPDRDVRLWLHYRADLLCESTRVENRLLWHLHELEPEIRFLPRSFRSECQLQAVEAALTRQPGVLAEIAQERMESIRRLSTSLAGLDQELTDPATELAPHVLVLRGCGPLTAAKLMSEVAGDPPIPLSGGLRLLQRHHPYSGVVQQ